MATTQAKSKQHGTKASRLRQPVFSGKKGKAKAAGGGNGGASSHDGPQLVGGARAAKRAKPNPVLLAILGVILVVGLARVAMPSLFGGGSKGALATFPAPLTNRHLVPKAAAPGTKSGPTTPTTATGRPVRNPFAPPPGFG